LSPALALSGALTFAVSYLLILLAKKLGWVDRPSAEDSQRKLQVAPVPVVGGAAILVGLLVLEADGRTSLSTAFFANNGLGLKFEEAMIWPPLLAAFLLGLVDDLRRGGLAPGLKIAGQIGVGLVFAGAVFSMELVPTLACLVLVPLSLNAWNTFDNADGAATGVGGLALLSVGSPAAAPLLGFLGWNLRPRGGATAYLGDSGSHLLGCLVLMHPGAWPLMLLPVMDLARVACLRIMGGRAPWEGDRSHLAHRMQRRGLGPVSVAICLYLLAALPLLLPGWKGLCLGLFGFICSVWASRPCPESEPGR